MNTPKCCILMLYFIVKKRSITIILLANYTFYYFCLFSGYGEIGGNQNNTKNYLETNVNIAFCKLNYFYF